MKRKTRSIRIRANQITMVHTGDGYELVLTENRLGDDADLRVTVELQDWGWLSLVYRAGDVAKSLQARANFLFREIGGSVK